MVDGGSNLRRFFADLHKDITLAEANATVEKLTNLPAFFASEAELGAFLASAASGSDVSLVAPKCGRQWGDFQTPLGLAEEVCRYVASIGCNPAAIVEPTCGEANFIKAALRQFPSAVSIYGVEIQPAHVSTLKLWLLEHALAHGRFHARIAVHQDDIFLHKFAVPHEGEILILGNPPWVTNAELATLDSLNLPVKANFKGHSGLDAMTGKSNFDISESIVLRLLEVFHGRRGALALLCKNSVIRNLMQELPRRRFRAAEIKALGIDAKKHFGAAVEASLLLVRLGAEVPEATCSTYPDIAANQKAATFGWAGDRFVADVDAYETSRDLDGRCPLVWRQGIKHDCAKVMELRESDRAYVNGLGEVAELEHEAIYPLLKSSDLKGFATGGARFRIPITQRKIGEDTDGIAQRLPKLWAYLEGHRAIFDGRKSSIYRGKPPYSIFGIGAYSFAPYKVAISGMYKTGCFTLVEPIGGKPVMLDDTCYFLGFDSYTEALLVCSALNSPLVRCFLNSLVFRDAKRPYTKDLLMRIDLRQVFRRLAYQDLEEVWSRFDYHPADRQTVKAALAARQSGVEGWA